MTTKDPLWRMSPRRALFPGAVVLVLSVASLPLAATSHSDLRAILFVPFGIVGYVIARRQPANPIGWILLATALSVMFAFDAGSYALLIYPLGHRGLPLGRLAVFAAAGWVVLIVLLPLPIALFPDGELSRRWRYVLWAYLADMAVLLSMFGWSDLTGVRARNISVDSFGEPTALNNSPSGWVATAEHLVFLVYAAIVVSWVVRQVVGVRRSTGDRRAQLKWFLSGGAIAVGGLVVTLVIGSSFGFAGIVALPVSVGIGILKYRLYEIDRLISRTLSYAIVTGLLVGVYVGMIALTTRLIPLSSSVGVAASTLAAVGLFAPLRRRVQHGVDRRFNRARYDTDAMVGSFTARLRDAVNLDTVQGDLLRVVNGAVEPSHVSLWIRPISRG